MRVMLGLAGTALFVAAMWFLYAGFQMDTSVPNTAGADVPSGLESVANLQLMHIQLLDIVIGLCCGIASAILLIGTAIVTAIEEWKPPSPPA